MSALSTESYLEDRAQRGSQEKLKKLLKKVPSEDPEAFDRIR
jgi:hypothetical protein